MLPFAVSDSLHAAFNPLFLHDSSENEVVEARSRQALFHILDFNWSWRLLPSKRPNASAGRDRGLASFLKDGWLATPCLVLLLSKGRQFKPFLDIKGPVGQDGLQLHDPAIEPKMRFEANALTTSACALLALASLPRSSRKGRGGRAHSGRTPQSGSKVYPSCLDHERSSR